MKVMNKQTILTLHGRREPCGRMRPEAGVFVLRARAAQQPAAQKTPEPPTSFGNITKDRLLAADKEPGTG